MTQPTEVMVVNPANWIERASQLAQLLQNAAECGSSTTIPDPTGQSPDPNALLTVVDPAYWSARPDELQDGLATATAGNTAQQGAGDSGLAAGAVSATDERLTLTVEEAAAVLGISRASSYEAVRRGEVPSIRIGRRILIPRAALQRLLDRALPQDPGEAAGP